MTAIVNGDFVHVVATVNSKAKEGKILYVNPSTSSIESDAATQDYVELQVLDAADQELLRQPAVVRLASRGDVGLIQADLPRIQGMKSLRLLVGGEEVSRYEAGAPPVAPAASLSLAPSGGAAPHRRQLTLAQAAALQPEAGVSYSVQVRPDSDGSWNTLAVSRPTPQIDIDRNQFPGAIKADVRVLRTTGFDEEVIAQDSVDLF